MPHLRLFGGASLEDEAGPLSGPPAQRHRLALLALLASHHPRGLSRTRLLGLLWPGRSAKPARNLLNQAVHQLRKALGAPVIRTVGGELRLDPDHLSCDLLEFRGSVGRGELARAATLQTGPFLDGFTLPDAPAFERWVADERARLRRELASVLEDLARQREAWGEQGEAVQAWRRRLALEPYAARPVLGLMRALAAAGERPAAIEQAEAHARRVREDLGAEPDADVEALAERLRRTPGSAAVGDELAAVDRRHGPEGGYAPEGGRTIPAPARAPGRAAPGRPLIGRRGEWERLTEAWRTTVRGGPGLALIGGEAGIGKTRLAEELVAWAGRRGVVTATARCYAAEGRLAYGPVAEWLRSEALRPALEELEAASRAELTPLLPELTPLLSELTPLLPELTGEEVAVAERTGPAEGRRQRFFRALVRAVTGRVEPRLLLVDDLQWSDPDTLQWLHYLLRFDPAAPMLVLATLRVEEVTGEHPVNELLFALRRNRDVRLTEIALEPLSAEETAALGAAVAERDLDERERDRLFRETEGHPLFVVEGIRAGMLGRDGRSEVVDTESLPVRVQAVIRARLAQLGPAAREVAAVAAVVGRKFVPEVVARASRLEEDAVADALDELTERRIVRVLGGSLDFSHDKLRDVVYSDLGAHRRRLLHRRVAGALETDHAHDVDAVAGALAAHYERAGEKETAFSLLRRAALRAREMHGHEEAAAYLRSALALTEELPVERPEARARRELVVQRLLGDSLLRTRGWAAPDVLAAHERALALAEQVGESEALCRALWGLQSVRMVRAEVAEAGALGERLLRLARTLDDSVFLAAGHFVVGFAGFLAGDFGPAAEHTERGLDRWARALSPEEATPFQADVGILLACVAAHAAWFSGNEERAVARQREALELAERLDNPFARAAALVYAAILHQHSESWAEAEESAAAAIALAEEFGFRHYLATARVVRGWAAAERGDPGAGLKEIRAALRAYAAIGSELRKPYFLGLEARVHAKLGSGDRAIERVDRALALCEKTGERWYEAELRRLRWELIHN